MNQPREQVTADVPLWAEVLLAAVGMRRVLEPKALQLYAYDLDAAKALPRKVERSMREFFASDSRAKAAPLPEGFDWKFLKKRLAESPTADDLAANIQGLTNPEEAIAFAGAVTRAMDFLRQAVPPSLRSTSTSVEDAEPSGASLAAFRRAWHVVDSPTTVLRDMASGIVTRQQMTALAAVYPGLTEYLRGSLMRGLAARLTEKAKYRTPYSKDLVVQIVLGKRTMDPSLAADMQKALAEAAKNPQGPQLGGPLDAGADATQTPTQRAEQR